MRSVLLVDDDVTILAALESLCSGIPVQVRTATDGREALGLIEQAPPALLVTDMRMPGMTGLELIAEVRRRFPGVRCVLHTGDELEDPGVEVLEKPCDVRSFRELIRSVAGGP